MCPPQNNGKIITSGGLSAGMDAALHVVARLKGEKTAEDIAKGIEYEWNSRGVTSSKVKAKEVISEQLSVFRELITVH